jgi:Transglycosylase SLT domain
MPLATSIMTQAPQSGRTADRVRDSIASASSKTGVNFDFLVNQARIESSLNPDARASTSSAVGLFQFTKQTWLGTLKSHGERHDLGWAADAISQRKDGGFSVADPAIRQKILDLRTQPEAASAMAAELASDNGDFLSAQLDRAPEQVDLYLAHFLGEAGAVSFLTAHDRTPDAAAAPSMPQAAAANRSIFYDQSGAPRSFKEIRDNFARKLEGPNSVSMPRNFNSIAALNRNAGFTPLMPVSAQQLEPQKPLQMRSIEPMPQRLSIEFARSTYQRLAALNRNGTI